MRADRPASLRLSIAPTTRAIWGPATIRNSSELTVASASAAPKPHSASRTKASAGSGRAAITSSGAPNSTSATVRGADYNVLSVGQFIDTVVVTIAP